VPLTSRVSMMLVARCAVGDPGLVFRRPDNRPLAQTWLNEQHRAARKLLKLSAEFVPHSLRHTFATRLGESGADAFTIMRLMGHSSVTMSQRYVHPSPESMENAVSRMESLGAQSKRTVGIPTLVNIPELQ
jgi:integrase